MLHDPDPHSDRTLPVWVSAVAYALEAEGVPLDLACWCLALLNATEADDVPVPQVEWCPIWLSLTWYYGGRILELEISEGSRTCYWSRFAGTLPLDARRPLRRNHHATLRDLLGWLESGASMTFSPSHRDGRDGCPS